MALVAPKLSALSGRSPELLPAVVVAVEPEVPLVGRALLEPLVPVTVSVVPVVVPDETTVPLDAWGVVPDETIDPLDALGVVPDETSGPLDALVVVPDELEIDPPDALALEGEEPETTCRRAQGGHNAEAASQVSLNPSCHRVTLAVVLLSVLTAKAAGLTTEHKMQT
jgi:hypothetical protein